MSITILAVLASVVVAAPGSTLAAHPPTSIAIAGFTHDVPGAPDTAFVSAMLAKGDSLEAAGRINAARRQYQSLIAQQRAAGQYPVRAFWHLVNSYYFHDEELRAASTLDELADAAGQF
jgi:hypothetical protein